MSPMSTGLTIDCSSAASDFYKRHALQLISKSFFFSKNIFYKKSTPPIQKTINQGLNRSIWLWPPLPHLGGRGGQKGPKTGFLATLRPICQFPQVYSPKWMPNSDSAWKNLQKYQVSSWTEISVALCNHRAAIAEGDRGAIRLERGCVWV